MLMKKFFTLMVSAILSVLPLTSQAASGKILFIPHDDRPVSYHQTVDVVRQTGYEMLLPPREFLSNATDMGHPDELWQWLEENASAAESAVIASDSMLYGGLIPSRKHEVSEEKLSERIANFEKIRQKNPNLRMYIFDSLMRTPHNGTKGDIEEPEYYAEYGADIFRATQLMDKKEISGLSFAEKYDLRNLEQSIPAEYMEDWMGRRAKNLSATKKLMDFTKAGVIDYLILGRDDNAPLCQTHRENREILAYAKTKKISENKFRSMPGIDEFNLLLLNRAINDMTHEKPTVCIRYNKGKGGDTIPDFSDEKIADSMDAALTIAGGRKVSNPKRADFVLLVHTDMNGETFSKHNPYPDGSEFKPLLEPDRGILYFSELVAKYVEKGYPVGIADINFSNGSDNALMQILSEKKLLFKLQAYSGWNTATNSAGFALGTGMLARKMTEEAKQRLLTVRYLDDWAYQANVRTMVGNELVREFGNPAYYFQLKDKLAFAEHRNTELMQEFAEKHLPHFDFLRGFVVKNPWLRMFECDIVFESKEAH